MPKDLLPDDAVLLININEHPQIATQIGIFVGCYAGLEITLWELYNQILGHVDGSAIELLGGIQSFAHRMSAVERFVIHTKHTKEADILDIFQAARLANDFRNQLLHGLYAEHSDKTIWLHSSRTDPTRREGKSFLLDP